MASRITLFEPVGRRAAWTLRWLAHEYCALSPRKGLPSILIGACRLIAWGIFIWVVAFGTSGSGEEGLSARAMQWALAVLIGLLISNLAKEFVIGVCGQLLNWLGRDFVRTGVMLNGKLYREKLRADGTWRRCEFGPRDTVCEWTDRYGAITRSIHKHAKGSSRPA